MIYITFKMPDVAAGSGGKSSESSRKYPTFHESKVFAIMHYGFVRCVY
jgi:hypothetical protein